MQKLRQMFGNSGALKLENLVQKGCKWLEKTNSPNIFKQKKSKLKLMTKTIKRCI